MAARLRAYVLLWLGLFAVYNANLRPIDSSDSLAGSLIPFAVAADHSVTLDRFVPWLRANVWYTPSIIHEAHGHYFSSYPIGGPLLLLPASLPIAYLARAWDPGSTVIFARIAGKIVASAAVAFSAVLLLALLKTLTSARWAWGLTLAYALTTETWSVASQAMWQHGPGELAIVACLYCLARWSADRATEGWLWGCGACAAAAFVVRPSSVVLLFAIVTALWKEKGRITEYVRLVVLPAAAGVLVAAYNIFVFDRISGGYAVGLLSGSAMAGLGGLFLSPGRGLLIYSPIAIFALFSFSRRTADVRSRFKPVFVVSWLFIALYAIAVSRSVSWWGGFCWGPRMLTELMPPLIVLIAIGSAAMDRTWLRSAFAALAVYSLLIQAVGAFLYPKGHWDGTPVSVDASPGRLWDWRDNPIARTLRAGPFWEPYSIVGAAISGGIPAAQKRLREVNLSPFEERRPDGVSSGKEPRKDPGLP